MVITPTFTAAFNTNFGSNAAAAQASWQAAALVFTTNFSDNIHINITVDAVPGTGIFGQSYAWFNTISYADLLAKLLADAKTQNDFIATGPGGSMTAADPTGGTGNWCLSRAQQKALAVIPDDGADDGKTTFGAGNAFTFSGPIVLGTSDFQGIAAHEISEVMGRASLSGTSINGTPNCYGLMDNFSYTAAAAKALRGGPHEFFSIDNGTTLLKLFNDSTANTEDSRDWGLGTNDAFNAYSNADVVNPVSAIDLQVMDVMGYDLIVSLATKAILSQAGVVRLRKQ